ncbi:MAG: hypothetical protein AB1505_26315 [Candidatus Latescibacterota bacterium]
MAAVSPPRGPHLPVHLSRCALAQRVSFSRYLVGQASLERPPFFYGYAAMWLHLLAGSLLVLLFTDLDALGALASMAVGSFCVGLATYGVLARQYGLLVNLVSYASAMARLVLHTSLPPLLLVGAVLLALLSGYHLLAREYRQYNREVFNDSTCSLPAWIGVTMGIVVVLVCVYGLNLL